MSVSAWPQGEQNLCGNLVLAASSDSNNLELNIPIGTTISNGASVTSANVTLPKVPVSAIFLVQIGSGTATVVADTGATTPTFASANKYQVTNSTDLLLALPVASDATNNIVALKITNNSGTTLTVAKLRLLVLSNFDNAVTDWHSVRGGSLVGVTLGAQSSGTGVFALNT